MAGKPICTICGEAGGHPFSSQLLWIGLKLNPDSATYAHPSCLAKASKAMLDRIEEERKLK